MKRIAIYSAGGEKLFSGNLSDLPFDDAEIGADAENRYGEKLCPQRYAAVKQTILAGIFNASSPKAVEAEAETDKAEIKQTVIIPPDYKRYLKHKNADKIVVYKEQ